MNNSSLPKAGILAIILVATALISWECYVRNKGFDSSYDDEGALWSDKRAMVYEPADKATVFIGSSRIKFDLDIDYWERETGSHAIQLACVGSTPIPVLQNLANDEKFKGKLVVDVTEILFFSDEPPSRQTPDKNLKFYKERTPAQKASFQINHLLESNFVFLDKERLSLNAKLAELQIPNRPGVFEFPLFPDGFGRVKFNRQEYMTENFIRDTNQQNQVKGVWAFLQKMSKEPPASGAKLDTIFNAVKLAVDKIKARGGDVLFVRTPSSGPFLMGENMGYPRAAYFDKLLAITNCKGIHFNDYPVINHFVCPEFSHLSQPDATIFTKEFIRILHDEKGWAFPKLPSTNK